jgi:hypothetical protein
MEFYASSMAHGGKRLGDDLPPQPAMIEYGQIDLDLLCGFANEEPPKLLIIIDFQSRVISISGPLRLSPPH